MVLSSKTIARLGGRARKIASSDRRLAALRATLIERVDEYWLFHRNPPAYTTQQTTADGAVKYTVGEWPHGEPLVTPRSGGLEVRVPFMGDYLPLTRDGRQEILLASNDPAALEELLALIKHAIKQGAADDFLLARRAHGDAQGSALP